MALGLNGGRVPEIERPLGMGGRIPLGKNGAKWLISTGLFVGMLRKI